MRSLRAVRPFANRHPLEVGADAGALAYRILAFACFRIVILRAVLPGIVGDFVIVPHADERMLPVCRLQIRSRLYCA